MTGDHLTIHARVGDERHRILEIRGPLNLSTSETFQAQIRVETAPVVILDMGYVENVDSNGIGMLALVNMSFQRENRRFAVVGLTPTVHRMLEVTRVLGVLTVFATRAEAVEALVTTVEDSGPAK
jgi:anti-sigma B factor antagonist